MNFYNILSKYYDYIFTLDKKTLEFLSDEMTDDEKVLDVACGTGTYAIALEQKGLKVIGVDLDHEMIEKAKEKSSGKNINFFVENMTKLKERFLPEEFNNIYCIGNSIVHLNSKEEIFNTIKDFYDLLGKGGHVAVGIINYDRIINHNITELPTIEREAVGVSFIRKYEYNSSEGFIYFNTELKIKEPNEGAVNIYKNSVRLLPIMKDELYKMFQDAGFNCIEVYGGFGRKEYEIEDYTLVIRGKK